MNSHILENNLPLNINVYGLRGSDHLFLSLTKLLWKLIESNRIVIVTNSEQTNLVSNNLWKYNTVNKLLPNGVKGDSFPEMQLIYIADELSNPNKSDVLIVFDRNDKFEFLGFKKVFYIFDLNKFSFTDFSDDYKKWELDLDGKWVTVKNI